MEQIESLFEGMESHLALVALLQGCVPGELLVDDLQNPRGALACINRRRFFLAGSPENIAFKARLQAFFEEVVFPEARERQAEAFLLYYGPGGWREALGDILPGAELVQAERQYYVCTELRNRRPARLPPGFELRSTDRAVVERQDLKNMDILRQEMCSERASTEDFLQNSFGVCALHEDEIAGLCLSEYNCRDRCEVGIMTMTAYQRRGLATAMAGALIERALGSGIKQVGWHCFARNLASVATALRAGFVKSEDYPVCIVRVPPG